MPGAGAGVRDRSSVAPAGGVGGAGNGYRAAMRRSRLANLPVRVAAGAFILNSGLTKLQADKESHKTLHGFASGVYPFLENAPPEQFGKALGMAEVALGGALLMPIVVGDGLAGLALSSFAGGLLGLYLKTPGMRQEGGVRPSQEGTALAKDVWLAGIGLTLMGSSMTSRRMARLEERAKRAKASPKQDKQHSVQDAAKKAAKAAALAKAAKTAKER